MTDFVKEFLKEIKDDNTSLLDDGETSAQFSGYVDTGSYILNAVFSGSLFGGIPNNKITAFAGESSTGKTYFVLSIAKSFLDSDPKAIVIYYDTEAAVTKEMMSDRGIDTSRVIVAEPDTIQKFRTHAIKVLDTYAEKKDPPPMMMVLDSLGMMSTTKEMEDSTEGKETRDMTKAQVIKAVFRVLTLKLAKVKVPMLVTNHTYDVVGAYVPTKTMSGGSGLKYAASTIAMLSKKKDKDGTDVIGNIIKVKMEKSRLSKENGIAEIRLSYETGIDPYYGLLELAEKYELVKRVGNRYEFPNGEKGFRKNLDEDPEKYWTQEMLDLLEPYANKQYSYGSQEEIEEDVQ